MIALIVLTFLANSLNFAVYIGAFLLGVLFIACIGAYIANKKGHYSTAGRLLTYSMLVVAVIAGLCYGISIPIILSLILPIAFSIVLVEVGEIIFVVSTAVVAASLFYYLDRILNFPPPIKLFDDPASLFIDSLVLIIIVFPTASALMFIPIYQKNRAEELLISEKERLDVTLRSIADGVIALDGEGRITLVNKVAEFLTGYSQAEALGLTLEQVFRLVEPQTKQPYTSHDAKIYQSEQVMTLTYPSGLIGREGTLLLIAGNVAPILDKQGKKVGNVIAFRDVTEQQKIYDELMKTSKMEALGVLAGGIAHDFNNLLTVIIGNLSLAQLSNDPKEINSYDSLQEAEKAAKLAAKLAGEMLTFAKGGAPVKQAMNLAQTIQEAVHFALHGMNVTCNYQVVNNLWLIEGDKSQLERVFHNLILNAIQDQSGGGSVLVKAENVVFENTSQLVLPSGNYTKVTIQDRGQGIPAEVLPKIFDPFFTLRNNETGLGLAVCYSIIKRHDGLIEVESEPGKGTTFTIYLPAIKDSPQLIASVGSGANNQKRVLVMDDEPGIRKLAQRALSLKGYEVATAEDGAHALELYTQSHQNQQPFSVVILDLTVPGGLGGKETIKRLLQIEKSAKVIVSSGYSSDPIMAQYQEYGFVGAIVKPYSLQELIKKVEEVLNSKLP
jgi:PAS domain S-box-containing protein